MAQDSFKLFRVSLVLVQSPAESTGIAEAGNAQIICGNNATITTQTKRVGAVRSFNEKLRSFPDVWTQAPEERRVLFEIIRILECAYQQEKGVIHAGINVENS